MISLHYTSHTKAYNTIYAACNIVEAIYSFTLTFLWLTSFIRTNSRYALLAWVTFWNGRLSFLIATFSLVTESYAALDKQPHKHAHSFSI